MENKDRFSNKNFKNIFLAAFLILFTVGMSSAVSADVLFEDDFEQDLDGSWNVYNVNGNSEDYARFFDDGAYLDLEIDTNMYEDVEITWSWKTCGSETFDLVDGFRAQYSIDEGSSWLELEVLRSENEWGTVAPYDLPSLEDLRIRFILDSDSWGGDEVNLDNVMITGTSLDETNPVCTVDYLEDVSDSSSVHYLNDSYTYINDEGYFIVFGSANDSESGFVNSAYPVSANRSSDDDFGSRNWMWEVVNDASPSPDWYNLEWYHQFSTSGGREDEYGEGEHQVCCKSRDSAGNIYEGGCKEFCIDATAPEKPTNLTHTDDDICEAADENLFDNDADLDWTWSPATDNPDCGGIEDYKVIVYENCPNASNFSKQNETWTSNLTSYQFEDGSNGCYYYIEVFAKDLAGNSGNPESSEEVLVDKDDPWLNITPEEAHNSVVSPENWYREEFNVEVEYGDDLSGLCTCEYEIEDLGTHEITNGSFDCFCNQNVSEVIEIDVGNDSGDYCKTIGENTCKLTVTVEDKAGNTKSSSKLFSIDYEAPVTTKTVWNNIQWNNWSDYFDLNNWDEQSYWISDESEITFDCEDGKGIGCDETCYNVTDSEDTVVMQGCVNETPEIITFEGYESGIYLISYWSNDSLGNKEIVKQQPDNLDNEIPEFNKTEDILYEEYWEIDYSGEPDWDDGDSSVGLADACYIWHDEGDNTSWHIRCTAEWTSGDEYTSVEGVIKSSGLLTWENLEDTNGMELNGQDHLDNITNSEMIWFDMNINGWADGFDFEIEEGEFVAFDIKIEEQRDSTKIFLGGSEENPRTIPFEWPYLRWVGPETTFTITADDGEGVGVDSVWYWLFDGLSKEQFLKSYCGNETSFSLNTSLEESIWKIHYWARDDLLNGWNSSWCGKYRCANTEIQQVCCENVPEHVDWAKSQLVLFDKTPPTVVIKNPAITDIGCDGLEFSVKVFVEDALSGVNQNSVYAELVNSGQEIVETTLLSWKYGNTWEGKMGNEHPAGEYTLKVYASDNVQNEGHSQKDLNLIYDVFYTVIPGDCTVDITGEETCDFNYHMNLCHGGNSVGVKMEKWGNSCEFPGIWLNPVFNYLTDTTYVHELQEAWTYLSPESWTSEDINTPKSTSGFHLNFEAPENIVGCDTLAYLIGIGDEGDFPYIEKEATFDVSVHGNDVTFSPNGIIGGICGNGVLEWDEQCDSSSFGELTCSDFGYEYGSLGCTNECLIDYSQCTNEAPEEVEDSSEETDSVSSGGSSGTSGGGSFGGSSVFITSCEEDWECTDWSECTEGTQTRACTDVNECETEEGKPSESQTCIVPVPEVNLGEQVGQETTSNEETQPTVISQLTGAVVGTFKDAQGAFLGIALVSLLIAGAWFVSKKKSKKEE